MDTHARRRLDSIMQIVSGCAAAAESGVMLATTLALDGKVEEAKLIQKETTLHLETAKKYLALYEYEKEVFENLNKKK